jgi:hypothetical protein
MEDTIPVISNIHIGLVTQIGLIDGKTGGEVGALDGTGRASCDDEGGSS